MAPRVSITSTLGGFIKRARLSLRTALGLIAVLGILFGIGAALRTEALNRKYAITAIDRKHGTYGVRISGPAWYRKLMKRFGGDDTSFYEPTRISFGPGNSGYDPETPFRDGDLDALAEPLARFAGVIELLDLRGSLVTDRGIASLPPLPRLKILRLEDTRVSDEVTPYLQRFPSLIEVWVGRTAVTGRGVSEIQRRCPGCLVR